MNFSTVEVFLEEVFCGFPFFQGQGVDFSDLRGKGVIKVDFVVIRSGRWNMIGGFFGENRGVVGEFWGKGLFRFCFFGGSSKFSGGGDLGYLFFQGRASIKEAGSTLDDSVESSVCIHAC